MAPSFLGGKAKNGSQPSGEAIEGMMEDGTQGTAARRGGRIAIEGVLPDIEIE